MSPAKTSTEEARDAKRQRAFHSAKDFEQSASQIGDIDPIASDKKRKVQLLCADRLPKAEVHDMLMMLGIHPDQPDWTDGPVSGNPRMEPKGS